MKNIILGLTVLFIFSGCLTIPQPTVKTGFQSEYNEKTNQDILLVAFSPKEFPFTITTYIYEKFDRSSSYRRLGLANIYVGSEVKNIHQITLLYDSERIDFTTIGLPFPEPTGSGYREHTDFYIQSSTEDIERDSSLIDNKIHREGITIIKLLDTFTDICSSNNIRFILYTLKDSFEYVLTSEDISQLWLFYGAISQSVHVE